MVFTSVWLVSSVPEHGQLELFTDNFPSFNCSELSALWVGFVHFYHSSRGLFISHQLLKLCFLIEYYISSSLVKHCSVFREFGFEYMPRCEGWTRSNSKQAHQYIHVVTSNQAVIVKVAVSAKRSWALLLFEIK